MYSSISEQLFNAVKTITLANGASNLHDNSSDDKLMKLLLNMIQQLLSTFVSASTGSTDEEVFQYSRRSLLTAVEPVLNCLFSIASDVSLWSQGYPQVYYCNRDSCIHI
jgi:hypothetical protein